MVPEDKEYLIQTPSSQFNEDLVLKMLNKVPSTMYRNILMNYVNNKGSVHWQNDVVNRL